MNKANYTGFPQQNFPLSTSGLDFIQQQVLLAAEYAKSAGGNYILSGCETIGNDVSPGVVIIDGELLPFVGGQKQDKIRITEVKETIAAGTENYPDAYIRRRVEFGSNLNNENTFVFADFKPFPTNKFLAEKMVTYGEWIVAEMNNGSVEHFENGLSFRTVKYGGSIVELQFKGYVKNISSNASYSQIVIHNILPELVGKVKKEYNIMLINSASKNINIATVVGVGNFYVSFQLKTTLYIGETFLFDGCRMVF